MLLFRVLYYLAPFLISVILLTSREIIVGAQSKKIREIAAAIEVETKAESRHLKEQGGSGA